MLGALLRYDAETSSDLVHSLAAFLEANGHWGDAADGLYVHRHTLRYRMKRVEEISGRDLTSSQDRMDFWLALKARELVDRLAQATPGSRGRLHPAGGGDPQHRRAHSASFRACLRRSRDSRCRRSRWRP